MNLMNYFVSAALIVAAIIHLIPLIGVLGPERLGQLYGVVPQDSDTLILMRHRAVLFGLLGVFCLIAAFRAEWQWAAMVAALVSLAAFIFIADSVSGYNSELARLMLVDKVVAIGLVLAIVAKWVNA